MWPRTDLLDLLGIDIPIIQAPMAGSDSPALAAAVSNAGALGSLGVGPRSIEEIAVKVEQVRGQTNRPFNLNFFAHHEPRTGDEAYARQRSALGPVLAAHGLTDVPRSLAKPFDSFDEARLALVLRLKPAIVSFHFGLPERGAIEAIRQAGSTVLATATTVAEAVAMERGGAHVIVAQGWEAGGHRGSTEIEAGDQGVGTMALVPQVVDAVHVPVIAAGGIADGRGIAAAFALGASGVQMGTAFLRCPEAATGPTHRDAIASASDTDTRPTRAYSGRAARGRRNAYIDAMAAQADIPDFPLMYGLSSPLVEANPGLGLYLYGQSARLARDMPAGDLVASLSRDALQRMGL